MSLFSTRFVPIFLCAGADWLWQTRPKLAVIGRRERGTAKVGLEGACYTPSPFLDARTSVVTIMKLSRDYPDFEKKLDRIHPPFNETMAFDFIYDDDREEST